MLTLATHPPPLTEGELSHAARTSLPLTARTLDLLAGGHLVSRVDAGYRLGFHPGAIYVADILDAVTREDGSAGCPLASDGCSRENPCRLCWSLLEADLAAIQVLRRHTLDDLRKAPHASRKTVAMSA
jgi:DNA-binding IscR family transcriptional regulator